MQSLRKSSSQSKRFSLQQFYQDLSRVQSSLGKKNRINEQSPMRPERQKKLFQVNVDSFYKQKENNFTLQKKNFQKAKLNLNGKRQHNMVSLNISELNTDIQPYERNYRQSQMPSYQMQDCTQMAQYSNINEYHNESLKYSENNNSNRDLQNLLSDDRLSQSSQKNCRRIKHNNFLKHTNTIPNQYVQQKQIQNSKTGTKLMDQMQKRNNIYSYLLKKQNTSDFKLGPALKQRLQKHKIMKKVVQMFKKMSNLDYIQNMEQLLLFLKRTGSSQRQQK